MGGLISHLASVAHYHKKKIKKAQAQTFFWTRIPHAISLWNIIPASLSHVFKIARRKRRAPSLSQAIQRCAQHPDNSVYDCRWHEILPRSSIQRFMFFENLVRSLLRQPRSALEAGPSEAHAISFVHTPRPRLHPQRYAFSRMFLRCERNNGQITNWAEASSIFGASGFGWWVVTHSLADVDFHDHRHTVLIHQHPFHVSRMSPKVWTPHILKRFIPHRLLRLPKKAHLVPKLSSVLPAN